MARGETVVGRVKHGGNSLKGTPRLPTTVVRWSDGSGVARVSKATIDVMTGEGRPVSEWDDEELLWGAPRNAQGRFTKRPNVIPTLVYVEMLHRMRTRVMMRFAAEIEMAVDVHMAIISGWQYYTDKKGKRKKRKIDAPPAVRLDAIKLLYDRYFGKAMERIEVDDRRQPWMELITRSIVSNLDQAKEELAALESGKKKEDKAS